ncbi:hypothetical protein SH1V18_44900 [Vallitalea longa]|uniref:CAAX prenyl protease 2/Lysostaphin resistance protein A-like domain-containing protein n=1 Tax=Vallitalea longa TaxID=2936439 RepID=A0A9W6DGV1_9FIRM|nr:CPBP family intramembrane glutamic endopeptidase [Vallitalea longa]GKX32010.1 hypothetical protein SH1V18_44900 [Vallitalea longa]
MTNIYSVLLTGFICLFLWIFIFKQSYSNTYIKNRISLIISSVFGISPSYSYSVFATFLYCILPTISCFVVAGIADIRISDLFSLNDIPISTVIIMLGIVASMSLISMFVMIAMKIVPKIDIVGEMSSVVWIKGVFQVPKKIAWLLPFLSASFEELFFRGVLLKSLISNGMNIILAISVVTLAFVLNQVLLTNTITQALVLGFSSIFISVIGSILFLASGSIIPSMIVHASFAGFYVNKNELD